VEETTTVGIGLYETKDICLKSVNISNKKIIEIIARTGINTLSSIAIAIRDFLVGNANAASSETKAKVCKIESINKQEKGNER